MKTKLVVLMAATAMLLGACHRHPMPEGVMDREQMASFLTEAYLIEGFYAVEASYDYSALSPEATEAYNSLLGRLNLTREEVEQSFDYYAGHPEQFSEIHNEAVRRLDSMAAPLRKEAKPMMPTINIKDVYGGN